MIISDLKAAFQKYLLKCQKVGIKMSEAVCRYPVMTWIKTKPGASHGRGIVHVENTLSLQIKCTNRI